GGKGGGLRPQRQRMGRGAALDQAARQPAGPRHDRARTADQVPNVAQAPARRPEEDLREVLTDRSNRRVSGVRHGALYFGEPLPRGYLEKIGASDYPGRGIGSMLSKRDLRRPPFSR